ncbi:Lrp/AsnC family transcriptional regulator [Geodermatophilus sp. SYSU D00708]
MTTPPGPLTPLDRRIVGALQVDGRASWRQIAAVLGEPERTVARRGARLVEEGWVVVTALPARTRIGAGDPWVLRAQCAPGTARLAAGALARRRDSIFTYLVTGTSDVVAEVVCRDEHVAALTLEELPAVPGLGRVSSAPVLRYHRTVHDWMPDLLAPDERAALARDVPDIPLSGAAPRVALSGVDRLLLRALAEDGRRTSDELSRLCAVSEATVRRRIEALRSDGVVYFRAVVEPALLGLPVEALVWLRTAPGRVDELGRALAAASSVRYAAELAGEWSFLVDVAAPDKAALRELITTSPWSASVAALEVSVVVESLKRSAVLASRLRATGDRDDVG